MQNLGLSESTPRSESRWRALFWPTIRHAADLDYVTRQGFWICFLVAAVTFPISALTGNMAAGAFEGVFFFLAGVGVRERSRVASIAAFAAFLLSALVLQRYTGSGFGIVRIIFLALLFSNIRAIWIAARWTNDPLETAPLRLNQTFGDKLVNRLPAILWPKTRWLFYVLAAAETGLLLASLLGPLPGGPAEPAS